MKTRKLLLALAAVTLGGCAAYPYDDYAYSQNPNYGPTYYGSPYYGSPYYAPGYYVGPSVGFGITYSDHYHRHGRYWR